MSVMTEDPGDGSPDDREVIEPYTRPGEPAMAHLAPVMLALVEAGNRVTYVNENFGFRPAPHGWSAWLEEPIDFALVDPPVRAPAEHRARPGRRRDPRPREPGRGVRRRRRPPPARDPLIHSGSMRLSPADPLWITHGSPVDHRPAAESTTTARGTGLDAGAAGDDDAGHGHARVHRRLSAPGRPGEDTMVTRGFLGKRRSGVELPPGQYLTEDFPVLTAGPTQRVATDSWEFTITTETGQAHRWDWAALMALPQDTPTVDLHCVTRWSKLATDWRGVSLDVLLEDVETTAEYVAVHVVRRLHDQPALRGPPRRQGVDRAHRSTARPCRPSTAARPGCSSRTSISGRAPSGSAPSSCATTTSPGSGRPPATTTTATPGASSATGTRDAGLVAVTGWRPATVAEVRPESATARTLVLDVPGWPGHQAGQHVDVQLTADDGYTATRSYSIASVAGGRARRDHGGATRRRRGVAVPGRRRAARRQRRGPRPGRRLVRLAADPARAGAAARRRLRRRTADGDGARAPEGGQRRAGAAGAVGARPPRPCCTATSSPPSRRSPTRTST